VIWTALTAWMASPVPSPSPEFDEDLVTPGIWGFAITLAVMVAVVLLIIDMTRRIRRVNYRAQVRDQLAAEEAAAAGEKPDREKPDAP
jgi:hypothetical protein